MVVNWSPKKDTKPHGSLDGMLALMFHLFRPQPDTVQLTLPDHRCFAFTHGGMTRLSLHYYLSC